MKYPLFPHKSKPDYKFVHISNEILDYMIILCSGVWKNTEKWCKLMLIYSWVDCQATFGSKLYSGSLMLTTFLVSIKYLYFFLVLLSFFITIIYALLSSIFSYFLFAMIILLTEQYPISNQIFYWPFPICHSIIKTNDNWTFL